MEGILHGIRFSLECGTLPMNRGFFQTGIDSRPLGTHPAFWALTLWAMPLASSRSALPIRRTKGSYQILYTSATLKNPALGGAF